MSGDGEKSETVDQATAASGCMGVEHLPAAAWNTAGHIINEEERKRQILRSNLRQRFRFGADVALCLELHEFNDDSLIRELERIRIMSTPINSNSAQVISSLMRRTESMERIWLSSCGITDGLLQIMTENMKGSRLRVKEFLLLEREWDVSCATMNSFLSNLEVDQLSMITFPTDYHEEFPIFQNVRTLKLCSDIIVTNEHHRLLFKNGDNFRGEFNKNTKLLKLDVDGGGLYNAVTVENFCIPEIIQVTAREKCTTGLKTLHAMLDARWEVDGKSKNSQLRLELIRKCMELGFMDMDLEVEINNLELSASVTCGSDIREAATRWSLRSLNVGCYVEGQELLQKFKDEILVTKIHYLKFVEVSDSYVFFDDDLKSVLSKVAQCQVEHLELYNMRSLKPEHLKSILQNCKLKILECLYCNTFSIDQFDEIQEAARLTETELRGIEQSS